MCGISGVFSNFVTEQHQALIRGILKSQFTRGPDSEGMLTIQGNHSQAILGHNRLSIIDLSNRANQPMWDSTNRYCISYNGEIYNYIELREELIRLGFNFNTHSDTEVILNAFSCWGMSALNRFIGPFAFALFDIQTDQLWLCRDRFGVRPLFYIILNNILYFASTTNELAKYLNLKPNLSYVAQGLKYLVYENGSDASPYEKIFSLLPGHYIQTKLNADNKLLFEHKLYYDLNSNVENHINTLPMNNINYLLELINDALEKAVFVRLRTDVPLAISLSSGLDSSSIASFVSQYHKNLIGFSFGHPDHAATEGPLIDKCAKFLNIKMEYVWPTASEMITGLHKTIAIQDAPFSSLSVVAQYLLYQKVRSSGIKVLLGGQGGDESFMGYKKFLLFWLRQLCKQKKFISAAINVFQLFPMLIAEISSLGTYWRHRHRYLNHREFGSTLRLPEPLSLNLNNTHNLLKRQLQDVTQFSLPTLLRYEDRNAMANSVESRLPFLDHRLVELGLALPEAFKLRTGYGKWPIREIMRDKIPDQIRLARYKRGFDIPIRSLLNAGLGHSIRTTLNDNKHNIKEFLKNSTNIESVFSDDQLIKRQHAMTEAITLLWLNKVCI